MIRTQRGTPVKVVAYNPANHVVQVRTSKGEVLSLFLSNLKADTPAELAQALGHLPVRLPVNNNKLK